MKIRIKHFFLQCWCYCLSPLSLSNDTIWMWQRVSIGCVGENLSSLRALALGEPRVLTLRAREPSCRIPSPHESLSPYNTRPPLRSISRFLRINTSPPWEHAHPVLVDEWLRHPREPTGTRHPFAPLLRKKIFPRSNRSCRRRSYSAYSDFWRTMIVTIRKE